MGNLKGRLKDKFQNQSPKLAMPSKKREKEAKLPPTKKRASIASHKQKKFLHKVAVMSIEEGRTLERLLVDALAKLKTVGKRLHSLEDGGDKHFINYHLMHSTPSGSILGCEFFRFEAGSDQSIIDFSADAEELNVDSIEAGEDKEFLGGTVYFGVRGDQVILIQSQALRSQDLESHLNWLIVKKAKLLKPENYIELRDHVSKKRREKMRDVTGVRLMGPAAEESPLVPTVSQENRSENDDVSESKSVKLTPKKGLIEAIKAFLGTDENIPNLFNAKDLTSISDVEMVLYLHWKGKGRSGDNQFLDGIASRLRHVDTEIDYTIETKSGLITKDMIKMQKPFSIGWQKSGRPKFEDLFPKMAEWLASLINDGKIDP